MQKVTDNARALLARYAKISLTAYLNGQKVNAGIGACEFAPSCGDEAAFSFGNACATSVSLTLSVSMPGIKGQSLRITWAVDETEYPLFDGKIEAAVVTAGRTAIEAWDAMYYGGSDAFVPTWAMQQDIAAAEALSLIAGAMGVSAAPDAKNVIFLSADAFGVLPPVSILTPEQAQYYFLSGFTSKLAGTERGITEPTPTFSACFGQAFLELHPTKYAEELVKKMEKSGAKAYLVNTGWNGTGKRISIKDTRGIIDAILDGSILKAETKEIPYFNLAVPTELPGVDTGILDPRDTYEDAAAWDEKAKDLAARFVKNFAKDTGNEAGKALVAAGPQL